MTYDQATVTEFTYNQISRMKTKSTGQDADLKYEHWNHGACVRHWLVRGERQVHVERRDASTGWQWITETKYTAR